MTNTTKQSREPAWNSRLHTKLGAAISTLMCADSYEALAHAFFLVSDGLESANGAWYVGDADAQRWIAELRGLMKPSDLDAARAEMESLGTYLARAQSFTKDDRLNFARTVFELYNHLARLEP